MASNTAVCLGQLNPSSQGYAAGPVIHELLVRLGLDDSGREAPGRCYRLGSMRLGGAATPTRPRHEALVPGGNVNFRASRTADQRRETGMSESPWHRHVSPIFFLLLVVAGLMVGFVALFLLPEVAHAVGG